VLSRVGIADVSPGIQDDPGFPDPGTREARTIAATCGPVRVRSVYVPNGRTPDDPHYAYKLRWLSALRAAVADDAAAGLPFALMGDFNVAPTDDDVWDPAEFVGSTHVTPAEREALAELRATGLSDVVPRIAKGPHPFTYWDYRAGAFHKGMGMRIDLVYANAALAGAVTDAWVDREARKGKAPSDHAPVVVDLDL
jgi:exodeoxyribonuclease-3